MLMAFRPGSAFITGLRALSPKLVLELPPSVLLFPPTLVLAVGTRLPSGNLVFPGPGLALSPVVDLVGLGGLIGAKHLRNLLLHERMHALNSS
jgi:hypothetical protein